MLGEHISDPGGTESAGITEINGLGLLPVRTVFEEEKVQKQVKGIISEVEGLLSGLSGLEYEGYEIHMGREESGRLQAEEKMRGIILSDTNCKSGVYGTYVHGIFDAPGVSDEVLRALCKKKNVDFSELGSFDALAHKERQYDLLAEGIRESLDITLLHSIIGL